MKCHHKISFNLFVLFASSCCVCVVQGSSVHIPALAASRGRSLTSSETTARFVSEVITPTALDSTSVDISTTEGTSKEDVNIFTQLVGYLKDSLIRTVDGIKEMWDNHGRCKEIRTKQNDYREKLKKRWEFEEKGLTPKEMKDRLSKIKGGITYDEFVFLIKGKEDRGKLMNLMFLMWGAPRFLPYALMFYPEILPSPFAHLPDISGKESKLQKLSRERSHATLRALIAIENEAKAVPALAKLNIFGKKGQLRRMDEMDGLGKTIGQLMTTPNITTGSVGGSVVLNTMENLLYRAAEDFSRAEKRLVQVPKGVTTGIMSAMRGPNLFQNFMPHFLKRGQVLNHLLKLAEIDNFLVQENIDLYDLSTARLLEACNDRMIGGPGRSDDELREELGDWLVLAVKQPTERIQRTGEYFNQNLARMALMSFYCVVGSSDARSASYLPRLMYQGRQEDEDASDSSSKKSRKR